MSIFLKKKIFLTLRKSNNREKSIRHKYLYNEFHLINFLTVQSPEKLETVVESSTKAKQIFRKRRELKARRVAN